MEIWVFGPAVERSLFGRIDLVQPSFNRSQLLSPMGRKRSLSWKGTPPMCEAQPECRLCKSSLTWHLGPIPDSDFFAGNVLPLPVPGGSLWQCLACQSKFRHPILPEHEYQRFYENGAACHWAGLKNRQDMQVVIRLLGEVRDLGCVLDIGCGTGEVLGALPAHVKKFGIEPSPAGVQAAERGISVLGASLDCISSGRQFDAITILDVIEHLADPPAFLDRAYALLASGGLLIVSTGDPGAKAWQHYPQHRFWYASFPEHLSFPSFEFFSQWARRCGAGSIEKYLIRYRRLSLAGRLSALMIQLAFVASPGLLSAVGRFVDRIQRAPHPRRRHFSPGVPGLFFDHQILVIRKPTGFLGTLGETPHK